MKSVSLFVLMLGFALWMMSCKSEGSASQAEQPATTQSSVDPAETHDESAVQLNQGQRWKANAETTMGITAMQKYITDLPSAATAETYTMLKENLQSEFSQIFENCTMTGEAHNQLHNYLGPLKHLLESVDAGTSEENAKTVAAVQAHLSTYTQYFE